MTDPSPSATVGESRLLYLDGWRGVAVLSVLFAHFGSGHVLNMGRFGVELFFVLSGRLMAEILFVREIPLARFFPRRISRVWPTLFVFATISLMASALLGLGDASVAAWIAAVTFTYNYASLYGVASHWLEHTWSLCIEEHAYLVLGGLAFLARRWSIPVAPAVLLLAVAAMLNGAIQTWWLGLDYYQVYWRTDARGASILLGVAAFLFVQSGRAPAILRSQYAPLVLGFAGMALQINAVPDPIKYSLGSACLALAVARIGSAWHPAVAALSNPLLITVGGISYSLYLWQQPLSKLIDDSRGLGWELVSRAALLCAAFAVAAVSYRFVEQPARRALNGLWDDRLRAVVLRHKSAGNEKA